MSTNKTKKNIFITRLSKKFLHCCLCSTLLLTALISIPTYARDVVFIHSYHHEYPWVDSYFEAYKQKLQTTDMIDFQMDTKRLPEEKFKEKQQQAIELIYKEQPRVVMIADDNALRLVGSKAQEVGFPVVFLGINANPRQYMPMSVRLSGVLERPLFRRSIVQLRRLIPNLSKIRILLEAGVTSDAILSTSFNNKHTRTIGDIQVDVVMAKDFQHWQKLVMESPKLGYQLLIIGNYSRLKDTSGNHVPLDRTSIWTSTNSTIPTFAFWRFSVGKDKAIGGLVLSGKHQGEKAAELTNYFLEHNRFPLPRINTPQKGQYLFSKHELKRWNITLPKDIQQKAELLD